MRSELKIGVFVGVVIVVGIILFVVNRTQDQNDQNNIIQTNHNNAPLSNDITRNSADPIESTPPQPPEPDSQEPSVEIVDHEETATQPLKELDKNVVPVVKEEPVPPVVVVPEPEVKTPRYHVVKKGESLYRISEQYYGRGNQNKGIRAIQQANSNLVKQAGVIYPGWRLRIPYPEEISP